MNDGRETLMQGLRHALNRVSNFTGPVVQQLNDRRTFFLVPPNTIRLSETL